MLRRFANIPILAILLAMCFSAASVQPQDKPAADPLPSWHDGKTKRAIMTFVSKVTDKADPAYVPPAERIAVFDNDGTLWSEQPMYFQLAFAIDRVKALAPQHPKWAEQQPFKAALEGDMKALAASGQKGLMELLMASHAGMTTDEFADIVKGWLATAQHPRFKRPYTELVYQPMLELLAYLRASGFKTYIVSGGGIEFMRTFSEQVYGIPPEQVIGSRIKHKYELRKTGPVLIRLAAVDFIDDGPDKPVGIFNIIGRVPIFAFGNSDGDKEMLQWVAARKGASFLGIVHHTDNVREYAYDRTSHIGRLDKALDEGRERGWSIADMKNDWKVIYPFERIGNKLPAALLGTWVVTEPKDQQGATFEFHQDGTMRGRIDLNGQQGIIDARVSLEGKSLSLTTQNPATGLDLTRVQTITTLTAQQLVLEDTDGRQYKLERVRK